METERIATPVVHMLYLTYAETTPDLGYDSNGGQRLQKMVATGSGGLEEHMARFTLPRDLYHGKGALEALKDFEGKRAMICVGGGSMKRFGFLDRAKQYLEEAGMEVCLFEGIEPDPSVETVMKGAKAMEEFKPDWIVAMGGGSPIDAAKAMWIKYEYPDITFEDMCKVFGIPKLRKKAHFCAISSTSGTATEVTAFSIITDYEKGIKYPIADFEITPDVAIVDPELAETMPQKLVAHTGMDAMTHAIEAYVSTANCDFTDPLALHAIKMIQRDLVGSYNGDMEKRDSMHNAQCLAGMAFPMHCLESSIRWLTRRVLHLQITAHISFTVQQTPCICRRSSHSTPRMRPRKSATARSQILWDWAEVRWTKKWRSSLHICAA